MFYTEDLIENECLEKLWKTANDISTDTDEVLNLPEICGNLDSWVRSEALAPHRRLSLRTSATLISGVARMYRTAACKLFEDVKILDEAITFRRKRENSNISSDSDLSSETEEVPEQMRRHDIRHFDASFSPRKRTKICETICYVTSPRFGSRSIDIRRPNSENRSCTDLSPDRFCCDSLVAVEDCENPSSYISRRDQEVQTSPNIITEERDNRLAEDGLDKDLPFGYIIIHDNARSRVPSRIIVSSINVNVRNLI